MLRLLRGLNARPLAALRAAAQRPEGVRFEHHPSPCSTTYASFGAMGMPPLQRTYAVRSSSGRSPEERDKSWGELFTDALDVAKCVPGPPGARSLCGTYASTAPSCMQATCCAWAGAVVQHACPSPRVQGRRYEVEGRSLPTRTTRA
jgi:hypothetical protein